MPPNVRTLIEMIGAQYEIPVNEELLRAASRLAMLDLRYAQEGVPTEMAVLVWLVEHTCSMAAELERLRARLAQLEEREP